MSISIAYKRMSHLPFSGRQWMASGNVEGTWIFHHDRARTREEAISKVRQVLLDRAALEGVHVDAILISPYMAVIDQLALSLNSPLDLLAE